MIKFYANMIRNNKIILGQVPECWREKVAMELGITIEPEVPEEA